MEEQRRLQRVMDLLDAGATKGLEAFEQLQVRMNESLISARYVDWSRLVVTFQGDLSVASTGGISPNRDLAGVELQQLHDPDPSRQQTLLLGVVATSEGGAVVFVWPPEQDAPRRFLDSLMAKSHGYLNGYLCQLLFAFVENTFFSSRWWNTLAAGDRLHLAELAGITNAYYDSFSFVERHFVPWAVTDIIRSDAT